MKKPASRAVLPGLLVLLMLGSAHADIRPVVQGSLLDVGLTWPGLLGAGRDTSPIWENPGTLPRLMGGLTKEK